MKATIVPLIYVAQIPLGDKFQFNLNQLSNILLLFHECEQ